MSRTLALGHTPFHPHLHGPVNRLFSRNGLPLQVTSHAPTLPPVLRRVTLYPIALSPVHNDMIVLFDCFYAVSDIQDNS